MIMPHLRRLWRRLTGTSHGNYWMDGLAQCKKRPGNSGQPRCGNMAEPGSSYCHMHGPDP